MNIVMPSVCDAENAEVSASDNIMSLRETVRKYMGSGVRVSWSTLPEVKSSTLLETMSEDQVELEKLKFCLITCEVAFNIELVELINLAKRSINWADSLPTFNRRTIASTIERIKKCSDAILTSVEKVWNITPTINMAAFYKILSELVSQFEHYITFCSHQEDFRIILRNAMRSKYDVKAASFCIRMNVERALMPLQHLKICCYLLQDIHSVLISKSNRLEIYHCKNTLSIATKLVDECYKVLATQHGKKYVEKLDLLLKESIHGPELESSINEYSPNGDNNVISAKCTVHTVPPTEIIYNSHFEEESTKTSEEQRYQNVNIKEKQISEEQYDVHNSLNREINNNINPLSFERIENNPKKYVIVRRQKPVQAGKTKSLDIAHQNKSSKGCNERLNIYKLNEPNITKNKGSKNCANSKNVLHEFPILFCSTTMMDRYTVYNSVYSVLQSEISDDIKTVQCKNKLNLSSDEILNKTTQITNNFNECNVKGIQEEKIKTKKTFTDNQKSNNNLNDKCNHTTHTKNYQDHVIKCKNDLGECDIKLRMSIKPCVDDLKINRRNTSCTMESNSITSSNFSTLKDSVTKSGELAFKKCDPSDHSNSETNIVNIFVDNTTDNVDLPCLIHNSSVTEYDSSEVPNKKSLFKIRKIILSSKEETVLYNNQNLDNSKINTFISFYDLGNPTPHSQYENVKSDNQSNPMKPLLQKQRELKSYTSTLTTIYDECEDEVFEESNEEKQKTASKDYIMCNIDITAHEHPYEEFYPVLMCNSKLNDDIKSDTIFPIYEEIPLYQTYNLDNPKCSISKMDNNFEDHVYEEINFYSNVDAIDIKQKQSSRNNIKISKPSGTSQRVHWTDISQVIESGLLGTLDSNEIALQEAKYEIITSEASYYKSLVILETIFIMNSELTDVRILSKTDYKALFSIPKKVKDCSQNFLEKLVNGWEKDMMLGYLCHTVSKFIESGAFKVYVECCANHINVDKTLQHLRATNQAFADILSSLETEPICQMFSLRTFLTLPMQRVTRLPLLIQAILRRLPPNHSEYASWKRAHIHLQMIVNECNEAAGRAEISALQHDKKMMSSNNKSVTINRIQLPHVTKKQASIWNIFKLKKPKMP